MQIRPAAPGDVPAIASIVERAYAIYIDRIGGRPGPMDHDYRAKVAANLVSVAAAPDGSVLGLIVLVVAPDHLLIENVAVDPAQQRGGIGHALLRFAEDRARHHGLTQLRLFTNAAMVENIARYTKLGYAEYDRRTDHGFTRVFMAKLLAASK